VGVGREIFMLSLQRKTEQALTVAGFALASSSSSGEVRFRHPFTISFSIRFFILNKSSF
jgi:hypothetical protein